MRKKTILILFFFFGILSSYGQCEFYSERVAKKFSKWNSINTEIITEAVALHKNPVAHSYVSFFIDDKGDYFLYIKFWRQLYSKFEIHEDQKLIFQLDNDIELTLLSYKKFKSISGSIRALYKISLEQIELLANNPVDKYRLYFNDTYNNYPEDDENYHRFNVDVNEDKYSIALLEPAACFLELLE